MSPSINPAQWKPLDEYELEKSALEVIKEEGNFLLIAGPGAGKTEVLAQKASYLLQTELCVPPRKILAISYKKDAERNIKDRVTQRVGNGLAFRFVSLTYDAFAKRLLDHYLAALPGEFRPSSTYDIARDINEVVLEMLGNSTLSRDQRLDLFARFTKNIKLLPINEGFKDLIPESNISEEDIWVRMLVGNQGFKSSKITFPVITILAEYIIRTNPRIRKALSLTYSHIFLDEFQDTTKANYSLIKTCFIDSGCMLTAVGDDKQRIMLWAGAFDRVFDEYRARL